MSPFEPYPVSQTPYVPKRHSNTSDAAVTCSLIALYIGGFLFVVYISLFWAMATDSCAEKTCNYDNLTRAYTLTVVVGGVVLLSASLTAIVLMAFKRIAFWAALLGIVVHIILVLMSLIVPDGVN